MEIGKLPAEGCKMAGVSAGLLRKNLDKKVYGKTKNPHPAEGL
jgi:hypothetical protein